MVAQLLVEFVEEPWVEDLALLGMQRVNSRFHADDDQRRDSDVVWQIPLKRGGDAYLLLMLEFQSTQDRWMALRVMVYAGLLWQHLIKEKRLTQHDRLPPLFPVVIYNGNPRWSVPTSLDALIDLPEPSPLWRWQAVMRYHLVDQGAFTEADLASRDSLAALLFRLENAAHPDQVVSLVDAVIDWFRRNDGFEALKPMFAALASRVVAMAEGAPAGILVSENLQEVRTMLATRAAEWKQQWRQEGRQEGQAELLTRLLERRFGSVPEEISKRIASADQTVLETWSLRLLDAQSLDDVVR